MGYMTDGLTFNTLRQANLKRLPLFRDAKGRLVHNATGSDWSPAQWLQACALCALCGKGPCIGACES